MLKLFLIISIFLPILSIQGSVNAQSKVGIGTSKIWLTDKLQPKTIYSLPEITVYNPGDSLGTYAMELTLNERQEEHKPKPEWFTFTPSTFDLPAGGTQLVKVEMQIDETAFSGEYYGYLEAHTVASRGEEASISAAAAAKLYFMVASQQKTKPSQDIKYFRLMDNSLDCNIYRLLGSGSGRIGCSEL